MFITAHNAFCFGCCSLICICVYRYVFYNIVISCQYILFPVEPMVSCIAPLKLPRPHRVICFFIANQISSTYNLTLCITLFPSLLQTTNTTMSSKLARNSFVRIIQRQKMNKATVCCVHIRRNLVWCPGKHDCMFYEDNTGHSSCVIFVFFRWFVWRRNSCVWHGWRLWFPSMAYILYICHLMLVGSTCRPTFAEMWHV